MRHPFLMFSGMVLGMGITVFMLAILVFAAFNDWHLTVWNNTIGEGWIEIIMMAGVVIIQGYSVCVTIKDSVLSECE
jgi:hypothetical protein